MASKDEQNWSLIIRAKTGLFDLNLKDLWRYKDLIRMFILRDFSAVYKQTILGPVWYILQPLLSIVIYSIVFGGLSQMSTEGKPKLLFYMTGLLLWNHFSVNLTKNSETFLANYYLFGKVYFPRLTVPIASTFSGLLAMGCQSLLLIVIYLFYYIKGVPLRLNFTFILFPYLLLLTCLLSMSIGMIISSVTIKYRDLKHLVGFGMQLALWVTPVLYPTSAITSAKLQTLIVINPMSPIIETFRYSIMGIGSFRWTSLLYPTVFTLIALLLSVVLFNKTEKNFIDHI